MTTQHDDDHHYFQSTLALTPAATAVGMAAALEIARQENWEVTVCIVDAGGVPLHVQRTTQAFAASYDIACGKAKSAALFAKPTGGLEGAVNAGRSALLSSPFVLMRGGVPIVADSASGRVVGAVGVSGVQADQDEQVAQAAVNAIGQLLAKPAKAMRSRL